MTSTKESDAEEYEQRKISDATFRIKGCLGAKDLEQTTSPITKLVQKFQ